MASTGYGPPVSLQHRRRNASILPATAGAAISASGTHPGRTGRAGCRGNDGCTTTTVHVRSHNVGGSSLLSGRRRHGRCFTGPFG